MPNGSEALDFEAVLKTTDFRKEIGLLKQEIRGFVNTTVSETKKVNDTFSNLAKVAAGAFAFTQLSDLPSKIIQVRGEFQNLEIAFTTMLKSKSKADALLGEIVKVAATTPFTLKEVAIGAKQLLAYGSSASTVVSEIKTLGDVAAGVSAPIGDLIYLYGTLRTQGRAYSTDIRQFAGRGIPIYEELGKVLKINSSEAANFVEAGKVGFKEVEQAFKNMTTNGGIFEGLTEKTSKSLTGLLSNFGDAVDRAFNNLGKSQEGLLASGIMTATELVNNYEKVLDILTIIVATYGAYKAALLVTSAIQSAVAIGSTISMWASLASNIKSAADAQIFFNLAAKSNPWAAGIAALTAIIALFYVYNDETQKIVTANELLADVNKTVTTGVRQQQSEITSLVSVLKNQSVAESVRLEAYEKLKSINPDILRGLDFQKSKTADLTKTTNDYILSLEKTLRLEALRGKVKTAVDQQIASEEELIKAQKELAGTSKVNSGFAGISGATTGFNTQVGGIDKYTMALANYNDKRKAFIESSAVVDNLLEQTQRVATQTGESQVKEKIKTLEILRDSYGKLTPEYKKYEQQISELNKQVDQGNTPKGKSFSEKLAEANDVGNLLLLKSQAKTENQIEALSKKLKEKQGDLDKNSKDYKAIERSLDQLNPKKTTKKPDEVYPFGSLKYWEDVSKKAEEALSKLSPTETDKIATFQLRKLTADEQAEKLRKDFTIRSFDEEIEYKKSQYELYNKWIQYEGQAAADSQFSDLIKQGSSYKEYLESQIKALEIKVKDGSATPKDKENLVFAKNTLDISSETFDKYKQKIIETKAEVASLTSYLARLKEEQANPNNAGIEKTQFIAEEIVKTEKERKQLLKEFLVENNIGEERRFEIQRYYGDLRVQLENDNNDKTTKSYLEKLNNINAAEKQALDESEKNLKKISESAKIEISVIVNETDRNKIIDFIGKTEAELKNLEKAGNKGTEAYTTLAEAAAVAKISLTNLDLSTYNELFGLLGQIGKEFETIDGKIGEIGKSLVAASKQAYDFLRISKSESNKNIADSLVTDAKKRLKDLGEAATQADKEALASAQKNASEAAASLKTSVVDFGSTIVLGIVSAYIEQSKLNKSLADGMINSQLQYNLLLNEQIRLKTILNSNPYVKDYKGIVSDAQSALADAIKIANELFDKLEKSRGAIIDKKAGFLGVGAFDVLAPTLLIYPDLIKTAVDGTRTLNEERAKALIDNNLLDKNTTDILKNALNAQKAAQDAKKQILDVITELTGQIGSELKSAFDEAFKSGTDAAKSFGKVVGDIIGNIARQLAFTTLMKPILDQFTKESVASFDTGGDQNILDDLDRLFKSSEVVIPKIDEAYKAIDKYLVEKGFTGSVLGGSGTALNNNSASGAIKGLTEETGGLLVGQFNALRITSATTLQVNREQLLALMNISNNSNYLKRLESIDNKLGKSTIDGLRAGGI